MSLKEYNRKRKFDQTPEPPGKPAKRGESLRFVVQLHRASRLHYDFRLEMGGSYKSWAVPRGPSQNPMDQRLAVFVEDHPLEYGRFEGIIPKGNYGAGTVMLWDFGTYVERGNMDADSAASEKAMLEGMKKGHIAFVLYGEKLQGEFALIRLKKAEGDRAWLLVKKRDEFATYKTKARPEEDRSAQTGRTLDEIAAEAENKGEVWLPKKGLKSAPSKKPIAPAPKAPKARAIPKGVTSSETRGRIALMPHRIKPALPSLSRGPVEGSEWLLELWEDGQRAIAEVEGGRAPRLYSKQHLPFERKFPRIVDALREIRQSLVLDGEVVSRTSVAVFKIFDLLYLNGEDLRALPLRARRKKLKGLRIFKGLLELSEPASPGEGVFLCRRLEAPYRSGVNSDWIKTTVSLGRSPSRRPPPPARAPARRATVRAEPPSSPREPSREPASAGPGPRFTHLDRIYWRDEGYTKGDLIDYYRSVAPLLLPHLRDRPISMHRFPGGLAHKGFFQKDLTGYKPKWVETHRVHSGSSGRSIDYVLCQNEWTLLYLANLGCIEMNPWLSRVGHLDRPDLVVIDLDPDKQKFSEVVQVAQEVRSVLEDIDVESYCKTSGGSGLHICIPTQGRYDYDVGRIFAEKVCTEIERRFPEMTTLERNPARRRGKMYLDCLQNRRGQTLASVYSLRPRPGAPVSTPLRWSEVGPKLNPLAFNLRSIGKRLDKLGDLWAPLLEVKVDLERAGRRFDEKWVSIR